MTQEEFTEQLDKKEYSYEIEGDKIIVKYFYDLWLNSLETLPHDVEFNNGGDVYLDSLKTLPPGVEFKNGGNVRLVSLKTLPPDVVFKNRGDVYLDDLIGGYFDEWKGNIEGIDSKRLLNLMINKGLFQ